MPPTLALIHTSMVFITVETMMQKIFAEVMPEVRLLNIVDDSLLPEVVAAGKVTPTAVERMCAYVTAAETAGADAVLSLCSSLGPAITVARNLVSIPVMKIDDAMTELAASQATRIGVMATVPTTLGPTIDLLREKGALQQKELAITPCLVEGAFPILMSGDKDQHDAMVSAAAAALAVSVELIVLAQASMTRLAPRLQSETGLPVLSSPRLGIEYAKRVLDDQVALPGAG